MTDTFKPAPETIAAAHGVAHDSAFGAVAPPLYLSSTYAFEGYERAGRYDYGRSGNPNRDIPGDALAGPEGGEAAVVPATGLRRMDLCPGRFGPNVLIFPPPEGQEEQRPKLRPLFATRYPVFALKKKNNTATTKLE